MESYCLKCKRKRNILNANAKIARNGRPMIMGTCNSCGSTCSKIVSQAQLKEGGFLGLLGKLFGLGMPQQGKKKSHGTRR